MRRDVCLSPSYLLLPVVAVLALVVPMGRACPRSCNCYQANEVHCTFRSLLAVPAGLPAHTLRINLGFNSISRIPDSSLAGLKRAELMMLHGNDLHHIPDNVFRDMKSLQVLKLSYNKLREISSSMTFSGLTSLLRLHLDHNLLQHIHPKALLQLPSLRLLRMQGNRLHQLHPHSLCTLSLLNTYYYSTLRHVDLSNNSLTALPKEVLVTAPLLEMLVLHENPWSCDCRLSWFLSWSVAHPGLMKCPSSPNCPMCASPSALEGQGLLQHSDLSCASPIIAALGRDPPSNADPGELQPIETFSEPIGSAFLNLSDQQGNHVDLSCNVTHSADSPDISPPPDLSLTSSDPLSLAVSLSLVCPVERESYEELWRILAYYSEAAVRLEREIMLSKAPALAYRYRQTVETEGYYHTGVRGSVKANPHWLLQPAVSIQLNRAQSSGHRVHLTLMTRVSTRPDPISSSPFPFSSSSRASSPSLRPWVLISTNYTTTSMAAVTGGTVHLACPVLSSGNPTLQWILPDGSKCISPSSSPDGRIQTSASCLSLQRVELSDAGLYHCVARAGSDVDILPLQLVVVESSGPPAGAQVGPSVTGFIGETLSLPCNSSGMPTPDISWVLPDGKIVQNGVDVSRGLRIESNGSLSLVRPSPRDVGQYRCLAVNQYGADSLSMQLDLSPRSAPPFRNSFPRRPQSAAGRSTRIRASLLREKIIDEGSGDQEAEENKIPTVSRTYSRPRQPPINQRFPMGHPRRRGPIRGGSQRRGGSSLSNSEQRRSRFDNRQRGASTKQKIDPRKWADLLAKIRQKTALNNISQPTGEPPTKQFSREINNEVGRAKEIVAEEMEGSSIDDQSLQEEGLHRVHPVQPDLDEWTKMNTEIQRENAINPDTVRGTEKETHTQTYIQTDRSTEPQTDRDNQSETYMLTITVTNTPKPISGSNEIVPEPIGDKRNPKPNATESTSSNPIQGVFLNLVPNSRPQRPWNARRRLGQRRRIMNRPRGRPVTPPQPLPDPTNVRSSTVTTGVTTIQTHTTITSLAPVLEDSNNLRHSNSGELNPQSTNKKSEGSSTPSDSTVSVISSLLPNSLSTPSSSSPTTTQTDLLTHSVKFPESEQITHISTHPPVNTHTTAEQTSSPATMTLSPTHTLTDTRKSIDRIPDVSLSSGIATATAKSSKTSSATPVKVSTNTTITSTDATKQKIPIGSTILKGTPTAVSRKITTAIYSSTLVTVTMNTAVPATASRPVSTTHEHSTNTPTMPTSTEAAVVSTITASTSTSTTVCPSTLNTMTATISTSATPPTTSVLTTTTTSPPTTIIIQHTSSSASPTTSTSSSTTPTTTTTTSTRGTSWERPSPGLVDPREKPLSGLLNQNRPAPDWRNPGANTIPDSHSSRSRQPSSLPLPVSPGGSSGIPVLTNPLAPVVRSKPRIADPHVRTVSVPAQSTAKLPCEAQGEPHPSLTWTKVSTGVVMSVHSRVQRFEVLPNGTFVIQNVQLQDRGTYICSAQSSLGRDRMLTTLEVWSRPPRIQLANYREVSIHPGGEVRLDCMAEGVPSPLLSWVLPDRSVLTSTDSSHGRMTMHTNGTLHILASLPSDRGVYRCVAANSAGAASVSVRLHVSSLPPVIHQLREEHLVLTLGMPVYTHCTARGAPPPTLRWKIPDGTVVRQSQFLHGNLFVLPNGTLHIRKAAAKDAGTYECTASNAVGADKRKVQVELREEPSGQASQAGRVGGAAAPTRQTPPPSIRHKDNTARLLDNTSYLFNTTGLHSPSPLNPSRTLLHSPNTAHRSQTPKPSSPHHHNFNGEVSLSPSAAHLAKHNITNPSLFYPSAPVSPSKPSNKAPSTPPSPVTTLSKAHIFSTSPSTTTVHYGGDLLLHCMVSGNPVPTIIWRTPNRKLVDRHFSFERRLKVYANGSLVVQAVTEKDAGDYLCIARNKVADDYRFLRVSVVTKPAKIEYKLPPNQMVSFGGSLKVDCLASGLPDPAVRWSLPDGTTVNSVLQGVERGGRTRRLTVFDNGTLLLPAVGMGEEGEYTCFAENQGGQDIMKVKVKVVTSPPALADANYDIIRVRQGATAAISCRATGDPAPAVTWFSPSNRAIPRSLGSRYFSERVVVLSDGTLEVRLAQSIDEGNYTCQASSTAGKRSRAVGLKVEVPNHRLTGGVWGPAINIGSYGRGRTLSTGSSTGSGSSVVNTGLNEASRQYGSNNGLTSRLGSNGAGSNSYSRISGSIPSTVINLGNSGFKPASKIVSVGDTGPTNGVTTQLGNSAGSAGVNGARYKAMKPGNTVIQHSAVSSHVGSGVGSSGGTVRTSNAEAGVRTGSDASSSSIANVRTNEQMLRGATSNGASSSIVGEHGLSSSLNTRTSTSTNAGTSSTAVSIAANTAAFEKKLAVSGQTVILPCPSHGSPPPRLAWLLPGNGVLPAPYYGSRLTVHRNGSLELRDARASDAGTFVCVLSGQRGESRIQVELDISETQEVAVLSQSPHTRGSPASVGSTSPPPPLSVTLHGRGKATVEPPQRGSLVASPPRSLGLPVRSGGSVEAMRSNQRPAVVTRTASLVSIITGETLRLSCHVPQAPGYPQGSLSWTLPSGQLLSRGAEGGSGRYSVGEDGTLTVLQATVFDRGSYACRSTDDASASVVTVPVIVIAYPPRITTGPAPVTYTRPGVAVELPCLSIATPRPTVTWGTPDMAQLRVTGQGRLYGNRYLSPQGSLIIQHPTSRDTGFYKCTAKNVVGVDTKATYLHVI